MPEDAAPREQLAQALDNADTPEAPGNEAAEETATPSESPAHDYEKRYNDLRSEFDQRNQRYSQYEQFVTNLTNPETQAEALRALGLEIEEETEAEDDYSDPDERWEQRFSQIEGYLQQQAEQAEAAQVADLEKQWQDKSLSEIEKANGKLSSKETDALVNLADRMRDEDGIPDYDAAYKLLSEAAEANRERYLKSKKSHAVGNGQAGSESIDLTNDDARVGLMADMLEAGAVD